MIENTVLVKIIGCGVVATGTVGGGYYAHTTGAFNFEYSSDEKADEKNYLIVKSVANTEIDLKENLYDSNLLGEVTKNFKCKFDSHEDKDCEIYKLTDSEKLQSRITIKNNNFANSSNIKEEGNFFKLVVKNKTMLDAVTTWEDTSKQISLFQKDVTADAKAFAKLISIYKVTEGKIIDGKKSSLITKVIESDVSGITQPSAEIASSNTKNYQCQDEITQFDCDISEITVDTSKKTVVLKNTTTTTAPNKATIKTKDKQFEVKAIKSYFENIDYTKQKFDVIATNPTNSEKYSVLTPQFVSSDQTIISGKDNFVFAVATTATSDAGTVDSTWTNYNKCVIDGDDGKKVCSVYKFETTQASSTAFTALNFSSNLVKASEDSHISANNYHIIKFEPAIKNFLSNEKSIKLVSSVDAKKEYSFTVKGNMYLDAQETNGTISVNSVYIFDNSAS